jgi:tRNA pseudouridine13 synthase
MRLLQIALPRTALFPLRYQAGTLLFHHDADPETLRWLRGLTFPLLGPGTPLDEPRVREAVEWVLGKEKLRIDEMRIPGAERLLFFKHEERDVLVQPGKLVLGRTQPDELNRGFARLNVAFTLPPGSYATLVVKRLFHRTAREDTPEEIQASARSARPGEREPETRSPEARSPRPPLGPELDAPRRSASRSEPGRTRAPVPRSDPSPGHEPGKTRSLTRGPGFRALAKARKEAKATARERQKLR